MQISYTPGFDMGAAVIKLTEPKRTERTVHLVMLYVDLWILLIVGKIELTVKRVVGDADEGQDIETVYTNFVESGKQLTQS